MFYASVVQVLFVIRTPLNLDETSGSNLNISSLPILFKVKMYVKSVNFVIRLVKENFDLAVFMN